MLTEIETLHEMAEARCPILGGRQPEAMAAEWALKEIERLKKDAERYRWLRSREAECNVEIPDRDGYGYELPGYEDELDAAIDAAMVPNA